MSKDPISRITDKVLGEMAEWPNRPLGQIDGGWCRLGSNQRPSACEAVLPSTAFRFCWSEACVLAELGPSEHLD